MTTPVNAAGLPALALPVPAPGAPRAGNGPLPASLQLIGPAGSEDRLLAAGAILERAVWSGRDQVADEDQGLPRLDRAAGAAVAVAEVRRDDQLAPAADLHALHALVPAGDDLADAELERAAARPGSSSRRTPRRRRRRPRRSAPRRCPRGRRPCRRPPRCR